MMKDPSPSKDVMKHSDYNLVATDRLQHFTHLQSKLVIDLVRGHMELLLAVASGCTDIVVC